MTRQHTHSIRMHTKRLQPLSAADATATQHGGNAFGIFNIVIWFMLKLKNQTFAVTVAALHR